MNDLKWDDLETFTAKGTRARKSTIVINEKGGIYFSSRFLTDAKDQLTNKDYMYLSYSKNNIAIIFKFEDFKKEGAMKLVKQKGFITTTINSFINYNYLDIKIVKGKYTPELFDIPGKGKCWGILLNSKTKKCTKCGEEKTLDSFRVDKNGVSGRRGTCKDCEKSK